ncbi:MAG: hypothetical protein WD016_13245 [Balneolaceae bacterium]
MSKNSVITRSFFGVVLGMLATACTSQSPQPIQFETAPYFFDIGANNSEVGEEAYLLTPDFQYSEENAYGWLSSKAKTFEHTEWERSRDAFLIDGASNEKWEFKADIPEGEWWLALWYEAGFEDSSTIQIMVNGENTTPELQAFTEGAEARVDIQKMYRVVQQKVEVTDSGITFSLTGDKDIVRLNGFALIPDPGSAEEEELLQLSNKIKEAGTFNSQQELEHILTELDQLADQEEYRSFTAYWKLQVELLQKAEKYFNYRGWSWATEETGLGLFDHLHQSVMLYDGLLNHENPEENPLYERALWHRGRLLHWLWLERGTERESDAAKRDLKKIYELHPNDEIVQMYNGYQIDSPDPFDEMQKPANAPDWAFAQWEVMNRLKHIVDWWVLEQQSENGEFGGKFGDDVEILRFWSPLILSGDSIVYRGWKKLADGVWNSNKVYQGYAKNPSDVEHSSEFISDTAPLMVLYTDDPVYEERLAYSADHFRNLWTGFNENGHRFFKSSWFSSTEVEMEPPKNRDVPYTTRATKAVRYYGWKSKDPETLQALEEWADAWLHVSQRTDKGKPKGIIPASIEYPSESFNGDEPNWYTANMFWDYFEWSGGSAILDQLLFTWTITGDEDYLEPIVQHLDLVSKYKGSLSAPVDSFEQGSEAWAAHKLGNSSGFWDLVGTWRLLTENGNYDELIIEHGTPFIKYRLTGNEEHLVEGIQPYLETIRYNFPMLTSEAIHTDRVHIAPGNEREAGILQGMITGYGISESASPYIAISWEEASRDITYLVTDSDSTRLNMDLYSFSEKEENATMRLWQLKPGFYNLIITSEGNQVSKEEIKVRRGGDRFSISLSNQKPVKVAITQKN